jgi:hypothetical protein
MSNIVFPNNFSIGKWQTFFDLSSDYFLLKNTTLPRFQNEDFSEVLYLGDFEFEDDQRCDIYLIRTERTLTERSSRKKQFDLATKIIREKNTQSGLFIFYDGGNNFRMSLVYPVYKGTRREFSNYRRHSFFVHKDLPNKTYMLQMQEHKFNSMAELKETFSVERVSDLFYQEFEKEYEKLQTEIAHEYNKEIDEDLRKDFALLFVIRIIFLGFVQKKGWLGDNLKFIEDYINSYDKALQPKGIYQDLLVPLFFTALNKSPHTKSIHGFPDIEEPFKSHLVSAPYLNGGLFREHHNVDKDALYITDKGIDGFIKFLFSFNFTLEENTHYDEELELNPEFLGIIFEKLVNKENGAVYTPRLEVDFMCRLALLKYLQNNLSFQPELENLYRLFFPEYTNDGDRSVGQFSEEHAEELLGKIENVTVCDPAIGSGAFAVGMLSVIDEIETTIIENFLPESYQERASAYERKKRIIFKSLYGVEVKEWAVWITQLRLWITLLIEADDSMKTSNEPLLPSFDFKIRQGDSLVQMIGDELFPISGKGIVSSSISRKINKLTELKTEHYHNKCDFKLQDIQSLHKELYVSILINRQKELEKTISRYKGLQIREVQEDFLCGDIQEEIELLTERDKGELKELESELYKLKHEINQFDQNNLPFFWRIDFPEIILGKGGFDIVIGNPPYVAQEHIADPQGKIADKGAYKALLKKMANQDFQQEIDENSVSGKSDLYTFFYIRGLRILNPKGNLTYICSNSWLDVEFGAWLQRFLLDNCQIHFIIDNLSRRVFRDAGINTIISVISAKQKRIRDDDMIRFAAFKLPFENSLYIENLMEIEETQKRIEYADLRINPISREKLRNEGINVDNNRYVGSKWGGIYIKAPNIYFKILEEHGDKLVRLGDIAEIKRGVTTGANEFFYAEKNSKIINETGEQHWINAIRSSRSIKRINISEEAITHKLLFLDENSKIELTNGLKKHIHWGESRNYHTRPTIRNRNPWYSLPYQENSDFVQSQIINDRFLYTKNSKYPADCVLNQVYLKGLYGNMVNQALISLNSSLTAFMTELGGRTALGDGALKVQVVEMSRLNIFDPALIPVNRIDDIIDDLSNRDIKSIFDELQVDPAAGDFTQANPLPDRKALDDIIFDALGFNEKDKKELYAGLLELTANRLKKARTFR